MSSDGSKNKKQAPAALEECSGKLNLCDYRFERPGKGPFMKLQFRNCCVSSCSLKAAAAAPLLQW
jgi:hypothetical protein